MNSKRCNYPVFAVYNSQGRRSRFRTLLISVLACAAWSCDENKNWKQQAGKSGNTPWNIIALCLISIETKTDRVAKYTPLECCLLISTGSCWVKTNSSLHCKKHEQKKWRRFVFIVRKVFRQGKVTFFLVLKPELWVLNRIPYNFKGIKQIYYSPAWT